MSTLSIGIALGAGGKGRKSWQRDCICGIKTQQGLGTGQECPWAHPSPSASLVDGQALPAHGPQAHPQTTGAPPDTSTTLPKGLSQKKRNSNLECKHCGRRTLISAMWLSGRKDSASLVFWWDYACLLLTKI